MADEHWFDARHRILTQAASRRGALSLLSALATLLAPGPGMSEAGRKKKRRNKKYKKKKWKKRKQRKLASCSGGICEIVFTKGPASDDCEEICQQCKQAGPEFCIHNPDGAHPDYYPTCCPDGQECCTGRCCFPGGCCQTPSGDVCLRPGETCCVSQPDGVCPQGSHCCPGYGCCPDASTCCNGECLTCDRPNLPNLDTCQCEGPCGDFCIGPGLECCQAPEFESYGCVDTLERVDNSHCGGCNQPCRGEFVRCCDGTCFDVRFNSDHCGGGCEPCPSGWECCHGRCIDPQILVCCRDATAQPWCHVSTVCCTRNDGLESCC